MVKPVLSIVVFSEVDFLLEPIGESELDFVGESEFEVEFEVEIEVEVESDVEPEAIVFVEGVEDLSL